ncbi:MAG: hypothetical protein ABL959_24160 [Pyrinomonadaceae bacterium]
MRNFLTPILVGFVVILTCCKSPATNNAPASTQTPSSIVVDQMQARILADSIVADLLKDNRETLLSKMEVGAREYYGLSGLNEVVDKMFSSYGKPLSADYKKDEVGRKTGIGAYDKPMRKFWYLVETSKYPKASHFIFVEIVPDGLGIASSGFAIVNFPMGVPPDMQ